MQTYYCNHCGISAESSFEIFLHIFTDHLHQDIGLEKEQGAFLLKRTYVYELTPQTSVLSAN